jgi:hypothetical protein
MPNYKNIVNPYTGEKISLYSQKGGELLEQYVSLYKKNRQSIQHNQSNEIKSNEIKSNKI